MKQLKFFIPAVAILAIVGCQKMDLSEAIDANSRGATPGNSVDLRSIDFRKMMGHQDPMVWRGTTSESEVFTNDGTDELIDGSSTIHRNTNKVTVNFKAEDAPNLDVSGHACTLWAFAWEEADSALAGQLPYAMYRLGGHVIGNNNKVNMSGVAREGQEDGDFYNTNVYDIDPETGDTLEVVFEGSMPLQDAENDFIIVLLKSHGEKDPDTMPAQTHTFEGGCEGDEDEGGPLGPCYEYAYSLHYPE